MKTKKMLVIIALLLLIMILFTGCMANRDVSSGKQAGFLLGIWHGWIAPIALIVSLFNKSVTIYEANNTGWWYNFGYYIAIISGFGGLSLSRRARKKQE
ncbi:MAG: hypothetical protein JXQ23_08665 [Clostridia bacterium]|nr:hypothetical protein [Clostridia bacterium]